MCELIIRCSMLSICSKTLLQIAKVIEQVTNPSLLINYSFLFFVWYFLSFEFHLHIHCIFLDNSTFWLKDLINIWLKKLIELYINYNCVTILYIKLIEIICIIYYYDDITYIHDETVPNQTVSAICGGAI